MVLPGSASAYGTLSGRIMCKGFGGCFTRASQWKSDRNGRPLTPFTVESNWPSSLSGVCYNMASAGWNNAQPVYNSKSGAFIGVWDDDSVDATPGTWTNRDALANCWAAQGVRLIFVGEYESENVQLKTTNGVKGVMMVTNQPYCNIAPGAPGTDYTGTRWVYDDQYLGPIGLTSASTRRNPVGHFTRGGYITQRTDVGCAGDGTMLTGAATRAQAAYLWKRAWTKVNGNRHRRVIEPGGHALMDAVATW